MSEQEKQLLLKDLCSRLPYGVKIMFSYNGFRWDWPQTLDEIRKCEDGEYAINGWGIHGIKPYLRPMSSMTEKEGKYYNSLSILIADGECDVYEEMDWLNAHQFDYRIDPSTGKTLIESNLAIEAPKDMYKNE